MDTKHEPSVDTLRRDSERTRAELAGTVSELRERVSDTASEIKTMVSPAHIKREIRTFVREESESLRQSLEGKVRENPLQAAAVAAAIGYPALSLLRAIPMPLMLIGAGLFLSSSRGKETLADVKAKAGETLEKGVVKASNITGEFRDAVAQRVEPLTRALDEAAGAVPEKTDSLAAGIRRKVHDLRDTASEVVDKASDTIGAAQDKVATGVDHTRERLSASAEQSRSALLEWVNRNPLAVAGIGAAVGAFIAAALPPSSIEKTVMGGASKALKDKAQEAAGGGLAEAKNLATGIAENVQAAASREGLDAAGLRKTADDLTHGVRAVAERGVKTALNGRNEVADTPDTQSHSH